LAQAFSARKCTHTCADGAFPYRGTITLAYILISAASMGLHDEIVGN
jgi:hypothetical protein